jgi:hypothetical protein
MADVRVDGPGYIPPVGVPAASEERRRQQGGQHQQRDPERRAGGREELAVALDETGRALSAQLEIDADGQAIVRVVDRADGQTVAILTPEELRSLAEQTGLPSGLLFQARS